MKKIIFILFCCLSVITQGNAQKIPTIDRTRFEVSSKKVSFSVEGGSRAITVKADQPWLVKEYPASWATLARYKDRIEIKVEQSSSNESKKTSFSISSSGKVIRIEVTQEAMPILDVTPNNADFTATGGTQMFTVKSNSAWEIGTNSITWIHLAKSGNSLTLKVDANPLTVSREGQFTILSGNRSVKINVVQSGVSPNFEISSTAANFTASGGTKTFVVTSTMPWSIGVGTKDWGRLTKNGNELTLKVDANNQTSNRDDLFTITSGGKDIRVYVTQLGISPKFGISSTSANFSSSGGCQTFTVKSTASWRIVTQPKSWGILTKKGNTLTLKVEENSMASNRDDYFTIKSGNKEIRVDITQAGAMPKFEISSTAVAFSGNGGIKEFIITSNQTWHIDTNPVSWGHLYKDGNTLTLKVDKNTQIEPREDFFVIKSGGKRIRVDIAQAAGTPYLLVNGESGNPSVDFGQYGGIEEIRVNTNVGNYETFAVPNWCHVTDKSSTGFTLICNKNSSSYPRNNWMKILSGKNVVLLNVNQEANYRKMRRRKNGGWVNMAIGIEGGIGESWYVNGIAGLRIGNYKDVLQLELGVAPGVISTLEEDNVFHMPVYGSLKLSTKSGKFYLKMGGAYNAIRDEFYEGEYSLRAGFGSAWKYFEWDWASIQFNAPSKYSNETEYSELFDVSNMMVGMRMAWYITR